MTRGGYAGKLLYVDLTSGAVRQEPLDPHLARDFVGGMGFSTRLAYDLLPPGVGALSPENVIILGLGPFTGTLVPGSARMAVTTKFPQSNAIGAGNGGVRLGAQIKQAGYDAVIVRGQADRPVYLRIVDDDVSLRSAAELWGTDIYECTERLWAIEGNRSGVLAIGQAGENLVYSALAMMDRISATGRGGLGAVMGAKKLKAIVAHGTKDVPVADSKRFMKEVNRYFERLRSYPLRGDWTRLGMQFTWPDTLNREGFVSEAGTAMVAKAEVDRVCGVDAYLKHRQANFACFSCPMADKEILSIAEGDSTGAKVYCSSFSAKLEIFVTMFHLHDTSQALRCAEATNRYGLDNQDLVGIMDQVVHLYERGVITAANTGGVPLRRDFDTAMQLIRWTAHREGIGDVIADGMDAVCRHFGLDPAEESLAIKGWRAYNDPRVTGLGTGEFEMVVNPRGAHHTSGGSPVYNQRSSLERIGGHANRMGVPDEAIARILDPKLEFSAPRFTRYSEDYYALTNALGLCVRPQMNRFHSVAALADLYTATTGYELSAVELSMVGERIWNLLRAWSAREGFTRKNDRFPRRWFQPLKSPLGNDLRFRHYFGQPIDAEQAEQMLDDYYDERGWNRETGMPGEDKLASLGLAGVAASPPRV